jgi:hypothetical protein
VRREAARLEGRLASVLRGPLLVAKGASEPVIFYRRAIFGSLKAVSRLGLLADEIDRLLGI